MRTVNLAKSMIAAAAVLLFAASSASAAELVTNGDFASGLAGWTVSTTPNGVANATPASFDVTGSGSQTAARLNVGVAVFDFDVPPAGGGLVQTFVSAGGQGVFNASIAAQGGQQFTNLDGGTFSVWLNGIEKDSFAAGQIGPLAIIRSTLSFSDTLLAGSNTIELRVVRPYTANNDTPFQYFTSVSLLGAAVPEPANWAMMILGFGLVGATLRRRRVEMCCRPEAQPAANWLLPIVRFSSAVAGTAGPPCRRA